MRISVRSPGSDENSMPSIVAAFALAASITAAEAEKISAAPEPTVRASLFKTLRIFIILYAL